MRTTCTRRALIMAVAVRWFLPAPAGWGETTDRAEVTLRPARERTLGKYPGHTGHRFHEQSAGLRFGPIPYDITYKACIDKAHHGKAAPLEGYLGMPVPASCNWYHSGFLFVSLNGEDMGTTPLSSMLVAERGTRAILDLVWHHQAADVRVRFVGLPGTDHLDCEIGLEPKQELESVEVALRCYPSYFTAYHHRAGARRIQTPATRVEQGPKVTVRAADNWWALYSDDVFDLAKGEGEGPCAMLLLPEQAKTVTFEPGGYAVTTRITYRPGVRRIRLAFWDLKGQTNKQALTHLRRVAPAVRKELTDLDFTPAAVTSFDLEALRAETEQALKSPAVRAELGSRLNEAQRWLNTAAPTLRRQGGAPAVAAEEHLLRALDEYRSLEWDIKLAELLATL